MDKTRQISRILFLISAVVLIANSLFNILNNDFKLLLITIIIVSLILILCINLIKYYIK